MEWVSALDKSQNENLLWSQYADRLCGEYRENNRIAPENYERIDVKRGLRNADGTGVVAGLTQICNVHGYVIDEGEKAPIDGELTYRLTHPSHQVEKVYEAKLFGKPTAADIAAFARGLTVEGRKLAPAKLEVVGEEGRYALCRITIVEGRNRQVRKMCATIKHPVYSLSRVATGELSLGDLEVGKFRALTAKEVKYLKSL